MPTILTESCYFTLTAGTLPADDQHQFAYEGIVDWITCGCGGNGTANAGPGGGSGGLSRRTRAVAADDIVEYEITNTDGGTSRVGPEGLASNYCKADGATGQTGAKIDTAVGDITLPGADGGDEAGAAGGGGAGGPGISGAGNPGGDAGPGDPDTPGAGGDRGDGLGVSWGLGQEGGTGGADTQDGEAAGGHGAGGGGGGQGGSGGARGQGIIRGRYITRDDAIRLSHGGHPTPTNELDPRIYGFHHNEFTHAINGNPPPYNEELTWPNPPTPELINETIFLDRTQATPPGAGDWYHGVRFATPDIEHDIWIGEIHHGDPETVEFTDQVVKLDQFMVVLQSECAERDPLIECGIYVPWDINYVGPDDQARALAAAAIADHCDFVLMSGWLPYTDLEDFNNTPHHFESTAYLLYKRGAEDVYAPAIAASANPDCELAMVWSPLLHSLVEPAHNDMIIDGLLGGRAGGVVHFGMWDEITQFYDLPYDHATVIAEQRRAFNCGRMAKGLMPLSDAYVASVEQMEVAAIRVDEDGNVELTLELSSQEFDRVHLFDRMDLKSARVNLTRATIETALPISQVLSITESKVSPEVTVVLQPATPVLATDTSISFTGVDGIFADDMGHLSQEFDAEAIATNDSEVNAPSTTGASPNGQMRLLTGMG